MKNNVLLFMITIMLMQSCKKSDDGVSNSQGSNTIQTGWIQLKNFPGGARTYGTAFSISNLGYVCSGIAYNSGHLGNGYNDLWQYNEINDTWTRKSDIPLIFSSDYGRRFPFSFVINNQGFVGGGISVNGGGGRDINMYNPTTNTWVNKVMLTSGEFDFSCAGATQTTGYILSFSAGNNALYSYNAASNALVRTSLFVSYAGVSFFDWCSSSPSQFLPNSGDQLYAYTPGSFNVTELTQHNFNNLFPQDGPSIFMQGIYYNNAIYQSFGDVGIMYKFDLATKLWAPVTNKPIGITAGSVAFNIGSKMYVVGGVKASTGASTDQVWVIDLNLPN